MAVPIRLARGIGPVAVLVWQLADGTGLLPACLLVRTGDRGG